MEKQKNKKKPTKVFVSKPTEVDDIFWVNSSNVDDIWQPPQFKNIEINPYKTIYGLSNISSIGENISNIGDEIYVTDSTSFQTTLFYKNISPIDAETQVELKSESDAKVLQTLEEIRGQIAAHDEKTTKEHAQLSELLKQAQQENRDFRRQLAEINTPAKLRRYSTFFAYFSALSIFLSKITSVSLLHPVLAFFVFIVSAGFYIMAKTMEHQDKKNGPRV